MFWSFMGIFLAWPVTARVLGPGPPQKFGLRTLFVGQLLTLNRVLKRIRPVKSIKYLYSYKIRLFELSILICCLDIL